VVCRQERQLGAALLAQRQQRRDGAVPFGDRERRAVRPGSHGPDPGQAGQLLGGGCPRRAVHERELDHVLRAERGDERTRRVERDHPAVIHDGDPVAQPLRLLHVVRRQEHRAAVRAEAADHVPQLPARLRIEPGRRLVEKEELRTRHQGARHREALLLPSRELPHPGGALLLELHEPEYLLHRVGGAVEAPKQPHRLFHREFVGQLRLLQLDAEPLPQRPRLRRPGPMPPQDLDCPGVGGREPLEDLDGSGLARAVRPEQAEALAVGHGQVEPCDRDDIRVALDEPAAADGRHR
jgi:hypothetical protein